MQAQSFHVSRRRFLKASAALAATTGLPPWFIDRDLEAATAPPKPLGPNDRPGIALIGCGGQGRGDCNSAKRFGNVIAVCDVDEKQAAQAAPEEGTARPNSSTPYSRKHQQCVPAQVGWR